MTTVEQLKQKRAELADAESALAQAEAAMDTDAEISARQRLEVVRRQVRALEAQAKSAAEEYWRAEARRLVAERAEKYRAAMGSLDEAAEAVRREIVAVTQKASRVYAAYNVMLRSYREVELLQLRFPGAVPDIKLAKPPEPPNVALAVFEHEGESVSRLRPLIVTRKASDTKADIERAGYEALANYLKRHGRQLSPDLRKLFAEVGVPDTETAEQRDRREEKAAREGREAARLAREVGQAKRVLDSIPGSLSVTGL